MSDLPTSFKLTVERPGPADGEMVWMRVDLADDDQKIYLLKPGGDPLGGDDQWELWEAPDESY